MNRFVYFMAVGLAFTVLQVATAAADHEAGHMPPPMCDGVPCPPPTTAGAGTPMAPPMCPGPLGTMIPCPAPGDDPCMGMTGDALITCVEENPPPSGTSAAGAPPVLTIDDPLCTVAPADRDPGCPPMAPPTTADAGTPMAPPMCPGPLGTMIPCPAPGDDPCISLETQALKDACHAEHSDEHGQVDCADPAHAAMPACTGG